MPIPPHAVAASCGARPQSGAGMNEDATGDTMNEASPRLGF